MADRPTYAENALAAAWLALDGEPYDAAGRAGYANEIEEAVIGPLFAAAGDPDELVLRRTPEGTELLVADETVEARYSVDTGQPFTGAPDDFCCDECWGPPVTFRRHVPVAAPTDGNETTDYSRHHFAAPDTGSDRRHDEAMERDAERAEGVRQRTNPPWVPSARYVHEQGVDDAE